MNRPLDPESARAYLQRGWGEAKALDRAHWASERRDRGSAATLEIASSLFEHMRRVRPEWPTPEEARVDLEHHVRLKALLDRTARVVGRR